MSQYTPDGILAAERLRDYAPWPPGTKLDVLGYVTEINYDATGAYRVIFSEEPTRDAAAIQLTNGCIKWLGLFAGGDPGALLVVTLIADQQGVLYVAGVDRGERERPEPMAS